MYTYLVYISCTDNLWTRYTRIAQPSNEKTVGLGINNKNNRTEVLFSTNLFLGFEFRLEFSQQEGG
jgi:hypothetical protein